MKPYYQHGGITIYHGDCRDAVRTLPKVDLVVTSPPYNRGSRVNGSWQGATTRSCKGSRFRGGYGTASPDDLEWDQYREWLKEAVTGIWRDSHCSAMWLNHKPRIINGLLWMPTEAVADLPLRQIVIWNTGPGVNINPGAFTPAHEWVMLVARPEWRLIERNAGVVGDVWSIPPSSSGDHPAPFPEALAARCIKASPVGVVLDPFCGSGSTLRAAKDLNRQAIGIEIEERYCEIAARRLSQEVLAL